MAATVGEEGPCTFCPQLGRVFAVVGDWAPAICGDCERRIVRMWAAVEAEEGYRRERLQRKKERARGLIGVGAT
ncbi:MAG: hypothetical protein ABSB57_02000 [Dehalococcoidia bacterium]